MSLPELSVFKEFPLALVTALVTALVALVTALVAPVTALVTPRTAQCNEFTRDSV